MRYSDDIIKLGLKNVSSALSALKIEINDIPSILISGTNGKGSTLDFTNQILEKSGLKCAFFTSPHVFDLSERIKIPGIHIDEEDIIKGIKELKHFLERKKISLTPFELLTVFAFKLVAFYRPDVFLCEVGLGGRLDATNILRQKVGVITSVSIDHTEFLGNNIESIAYEKAGIIKPESHVVTGLINKEAMEVIKDVASEKKARIYSPYIDYTFDIDINDHHLESTLKVEFEKQQYILKINTPFETIVINAATSIVTSVLFGRLNGINVKIPDRLNLRIPGRRQIKKIDSRTFIFDVAHNIDALDKLFRETNKLFKKKPVIVLSPLKNRDFISIIDIAKNYGKVFLVDTDNPRTITVKDLPEEDWISKEEVFNINDSEIIICTGSFSIVRECLLYLESKE